MADGGVVGQVVRWLNPAAMADAEVDSLAGWGEADWARARQAIVMQGLAGYFYHTLPASRLDARLPAAFHDWLAQQHAAQQARFERLREDLAVVLGALARAGIAAAPLKGSLLTTLVYPHPAMRPMGDIDLLVRPGDRAAAGEQMRRLGYDFVPPDTAQSHHDVYLRPENRDVVSFTGEHPDNPRPVEIHTGLSKILWADYPTPDITALYWANARQVELFGQPVWVPQREHWLAYLAFHGLAHLLISTGRAIQWVDAALLMGDGLDRVEAIPRPDLVYPYLRLASRALPVARVEGALAQMAERAHPRARRWAETAPLDGRCGLVTAMDAPRRRRWVLRWRRWRPDATRLALALGDQPLWKVWVGYVGMAARRWVGGDGSERPFTA